MSRYARVFGSDRNMRIAFRQPLAHVGRGGNVTGQLDVPGLILLGSNVPAGPSSQRYANVVGLNPLRMEYYADVGGTLAAPLFDQGIVFSDGFTCSDVALGFSMWRFCGDLVFHYEPQSSTALTTRLDFSYTEDGAHPILGLTNTGVRGPTVVNIDSTPYSVAFGPWNAWTMRVPADQSWKYTYGSPAFRVSQATVTFPTSDVRLSSSGAIALTVTGGTANDVYGRLLMECEIEFKDPAPLAAVSNYYTAERIRSALEPFASESPPDPPAESKEEKKEMDPPPSPALEPVQLRRMPRFSPPDEHKSEEEWEEVLRARFKPDPSTLPGSPGYTPTKQNSKK
jgi:hypothetical protein